MRRALQCHPDSPCFAAIGIDVEIAHARAGTLVLHYRVTGTIDGLRLPPVVSSARAHELWLHTCFEAFVGTSSCTPYYEFNFAPSTQWAAYQFDGYRSGMRAATAIEPQIEVHASPECYALQAVLALDRLSNLPRDIKWRLGLSAMIEETSGRQSYWALAHPPGKADFHQSDCFVHEFFPTWPT
jgi:hypothetical protein